MRIHINFYDIISRQKVADIIQYTDFEINEAMINFVKKFENMLTLTSMFLLLCESQI